MQREIVQASLPGVHHLGYSGNGLGIELAVTHDAQAAGSFGDQDPAVREEGESVWVVEASYGRDSKFRAGDFGAAGTASAAVENQRPIEGRGLDGDLLTG